MAQDSVKGKRFLDKVYTVSLALCYSISVSSSIGEWAIEYAYNERGYVAYGGEYLLIGMVFIGSFWAVKKILEKRGNGS